MEKFQHITGTKTKTKNNIGHIEEGKRNSFILPIKRCPKVAELSAKRELLGRVFYHGGKQECVRTPGFSSYAGCCQRGPFISGPIQNTEL